MLSTTCSAAMTVLTQHNRRPVSKPAVVDCYSHFMNGVDIVDQHSVYYSFIRKTVKWWKKIVFWLKETSMVNSYILYKLTVSVASPKSLVAYRWSVMESLASRHISMSLSRPCVGRPRKQKHPDGDTPERLNGRLHIIEIRKQRSGTPSLLAQADREPYSPSCSHAGRLHFLESRYKLISRRGVPAYLILPRAMS